MLVARAAPELVESLVLVDPALPVVRPRLDGDVFRRLGLPLVPGLGPRAVRAGITRAIGNPVQLVDTMFELLCADPSRIRPEDRAAALAMARERVRMPWAADAFADAARSIFTIVVRGRAFARRVASIEAPALVIHGDKDRLVDVASSKWLIRQRPGWELDVFDDVGHIPQLEVPDRFLASVRAWLDDAVAAEAG